MYVILDKESTKFYNNHNAYVAENNTTDIEFCTNFARKFRTVEAAEKFIKKKFTNISNYVIIYVE